MSKSGKNQSVNNQELERQLDALMRRKGWLLPRTAAQVEAAEKMMGQTEFDLPSSLAAPETLRHRLVSSAAKTKDQTSWTNSSVVLFARNRDPIEGITELARKVVLEALENGWSGPPYDPFLLAEMRKIRLVPSQEVLDARTTASAAGVFTTEFNPDKPRERVRYTIAHEIAHTLFPDCAHAVRHRGFHDDMAPDNWQLETLCNIAASEILMPFGTLKKEETDEVTVNVIGSLRKKYEVSPEAALWRLTHLTDRACLAFAARRDASGRYAIDYTVPSRFWKQNISWKQNIGRGFLLPKTTKAHECTAMGYTTVKSPEKWFPAFGEWLVEYLGIPPYPGELFPRVLGIASPFVEQTQDVSEIKVIKGNALKPRGEGNRIIVQLVNDRARTWGAGFAKNVRKRWPEVQVRFTEWFDSFRSTSRLGAIHLAEIEPSLFLASIVGQHGYGPSPKPRIRYRAIAQALENLAKVAIEKNATLHMPKIGSGESKGSWEIVREIIDEVVCRKHISVTVYELPDAEPTLPQQPPLLF